MTRSGSTPLPPGRRRVLLVFPRAFEPNTVPPLGIALLAACLKERSHDVDLLDLTVQPLPPLDLDRYCLVGMTLLCTNFPAGTELARQIRRANDSVCLVAGGPFADACPDDVLGTGVFDVVAHGEGERTLPAIVAALQNERPLDDIPGLSLIRHGQIVRTPNPPAIGNLDELPFPAYELLPMNRYTTHSVMASRGCPFACVFCDRGPAESRRMRYLSPRNVQRWVTRMLDEHGTKPIRILDSTFTLDQHWAERVCDLLIETGRELRWHCQSRIDCVNPTLLEKMLDAGCTEFMTGLESGNDEILGLSNKRLTKAKIRDGARLFRDGRAPLLRTIFIIGHPWDTFESIYETVDFADELEDRYGTKSGFFMMVPFPGTELWEHADEYGIEISTDWQHFNKLSFMGEPERVSSTFSSKYLSAEDLDWVYQEIFRSRRSRRS